MKDVSSNFKNILFIFAFIFIFAPSVFSANYTTYQAKIVKPDGYPLEANSVNFKFTILDPSGSCILYSENYNSVNMNSTGGMISFSLGSGVKTYPASSPTFVDVFNNGTSSLSCDAGGPGNYSPGANDTRKIVMQFHDGTGWQTLPAMTINAVPYAMYANEATKLNGLTSSDFVQVSTVPTCTASEALRYTGAGFTCVAVGSSGSVTSSTVVTALGYTPADGASLTTVTANVSSVSSTVFSVSSTVTSLQNSVAASFAAITSSQWTTSGTNIFYNTGKIGVGTTTPVTALDVSGGVRIGAESTTCAPALAGTLRYNASNVEYCNGTTWQAFGVSGAGITNFNGSTSGTQSFTTGTGGTAPNFNTSNGVHSLNIPLASTGSVTAGLLSNADYTTFTNKITSSTASIAQVLGYVPADNAASGTYAQKANNLSDLTNTATARTNLGLGTFATANSIDLGSASATGTLAIARLPSFTGDATIAAASNTIILSNSGVTAGTYTKVTVDAKGRVTSSAALASSDVTTALGYTPANSATITSSQWNTSGTTINYMTGNVGIASSTPGSRLVIKGAGMTAATSSLHITDSSNNSLLYVGNDGKVGVGSTSPLSALHVIGRGASAGALIDSITNAAIFIQPNNATLWGVGFGVITGASYTQYVQATNPAGSLAKDFVINPFGGNVGIGTSTPITKLDVSGGVRISMEAATCTASYAGTLRYTGGNIEYCNGSSWAAFGVATTGVNVLNGSASQTQTFANGTTGTAPAFSTLNGVHTLNIPLASAGSVTGGLLSNADYTTFMGKITSSAASISQVLGYAPVSTTTLGNYVLKANNLSDLTSSATARTNLGLGTFATASTIDLGSASATGTLGIARLPAFSGDATIAAASNTIILSNSGVTAGTYTKVTVDVKGRVISSSALASSDVTTALGYTPANSATITSSQWTTSGTNIYYNTGSVGIGTTTPTHPLHTYRNTTMGAAWGGFNTTSAVVRIQEATGNGLYFDANSILSDVSGVFAIGTLQSHAITFGTSDTERMRVDATGNVGIGTNSPASRLHLADSNAVMLTLDRSNNQNSLIEYKNTLGSMYAGLITGSTNWGVGTGNDLGTNGVFTVTNAGRVYIGGTTAPTARLHITAGTSSVASIKLTSGTLLSSPQSGTIEYDGTDFYITDGNNNRRTIATASTAGTLDNVTVVSSPSGIALWPAAGNSVTVSATTASTNSSTGALIVKGGMGIAGNLYSSGTIITSSNIQGASITATSGLIAPYIYGSTAASGDLYINSTTHATKGDLILMNQGGKVGIGTTTPLVVLTVDDTAGTVSAPYVSSTDKLAVMSTGNGIIQVTTPNTATGGIYFSDPESRDPGGIAYSHLTDSMTIRANGATRMTLTASGNLGIATTTPSEKLHVNGNIFANMGEGFRIYGDANYFGANNDGIVFEQQDVNNTGGATDGGFVFRGYSVSDTTAREWMTIKSPGNVGIGTTSPNASLDVSGSMIVTGGIFGANTGAPDTTIFGVSKTTYPNWGLFYNEGSPDYIEYKSAGVVTSRIELDSGSAHFGLNGGSVGIATSAPSGVLSMNMGTGFGSAHFGGLYPDLWFDGGTDSVFYLSNRGAASGRTSITYNSTEYFTVTNSGTVGIGTTAPTTGYKLDVLGDIYVGAGGSAQTIRFRTANTDGGFIRFNSTADTAGNSSLEIGTTDNSDEPIIFTQTANERMRIHTNGYVGIGTVAPTKTLTVAGSAAFGSAPNSATRGTDYISIVTSSTTNRRTGIQFQQNAVHTFELGTDVSLNNGQNFYIYDNVAGAARFLVDGAGNVGIGTGAPDERFVVSNGSTTGKYTTGGWTHSSDARLKHDIKPLENSLEKVVQLRGVAYTYNNDPKNQRQIGFLAQEVEPLFPQVVLTDKKGFKSMIYANLVAPVVEAIKELFQRLLGVEETIKQQSQEIEMLKTKSSQLEEQNKALKDYLCEKDPNAKICK